MKQILQDLSFAEVEQLMAELGEQKYRAGQLYRGLMRGKKNCRHHRALRRLEAKTAAAV